MERFLPQASPATLWLAGCPPAPRCPLTPACPVALSCLICLSCSCWLLLLASLLAAWLAALPRWPSQMSAFLLAFLFALLAA